MLSGLISVQELLFRSQDYWCKLNENNKSIPFKISKIVGAEHYFMIIVCLLIIMNLIIKSSLLF